MKKQHQADFNWIPNGFSKITTLDQNTFDFVLASLQNTLGNADSVKCLCVDPDKSTIYLAKCWLRILDELIHSKSAHSGHAFIRFLHKTLVSYHNLHVCSTKTALCFTILLWKRIQYTLEGNRLSTKLLSKHLALVLEKSIGLVEQNEIKNLPNAKSNKNERTNKNTRILSRHMQNMSLSSEYEVASNSGFYEKLLYGLARHQDIFGRLMLELLEFHEEINQTFCLEKIYIKGSSSKANLARQEVSYKIFRGILLASDASNAQIIGTTDTATRPLNSLFISASLTKDHAHLGFNKNLNFSKYSSNIGLHRQETSPKWAENIQNIFLKHEIRAVFIRDKMEENLREFCRYHAILVFERFTEEKQFTAFFKCPSLVYMEDFTPGHIFQVKLAPLDTDSYVNIRKVNESADDVFSILVETRLESSRLMHTEYLRHCLKRLSNVLSSGRFLNGTCARIEKYLSDELSLHVDLGLVDEESLLYSELARKIVSDAFADFYLMIVANVSDQADCPDVFDDFQSKCEAWRLSFYINRIFLESDYAISN